MRLLIIIFTAVLDFKVPSCCSILFSDIVVNVHRMNDSTVSMQFGLVLNRIIHGLAKGDSHSEDLLEAAIPNVR